MNDESKSIKPSNEEWAEAFLKADRASSRQGRANHRRRTVRIMETAIELIAQQLAVGAQRISLTTIGSEAFERADRGYFDVSNTGKVLQAIRNISGRLAVYYVRYEPRLQVLILDDGRFFKKIYGQGEVK